MSTPDDDNELERITDPGLRAGKQPNGAGASLTNGQTDQGPTGGFVGSDAWLRSGRGHSPIETQEEVDEEPVNGVSRVMAAVTGLFAKVFGRNS